MCIGRFRWWFIYWCLVFFGGCCGVVFEDDFEIGDIFWWVF